MFVGVGRQAPQLALEMRFGNPMNVGLGRVVVVVVVVVVVALVLALPVLPVLPPVMAGVAFALFNFKDFTRPRADQCFFSFTDVVVGKTHAGDARFFAGAGKYFFLGKIHRGPNGFPERKKQQKRCEKETAR